MLTLILSAWAIHPVLLVGPPEEAMANASADSGIPAWELTPIVLGSMFPTPTLLGATELRCGAPVTSLDGLREAVRTAETRLRDGRFTVMREVLGPHIEPLGCLSVPAEATLIGRALFLYGYASFELGDHTRAVATWRRALDFLPNLQWDDRIDPDRGAVFREMLASPRPLDALLYVGPGLSVPWVDGRPATVVDGVVRLPAGPHLVQVVEPVQTWMLEARPGAPAVLLSGRTVESADLGDPVVQPALTALVEWRFSGSEALAWDGGRSWSMQDGVWQPLPPSPAMVAEARARPARFLLGAGLATTTLGIAALGTELILLEGARNRPAEGYGAAGDKDLEWRQRVARGHTIGAAAAGGVTALGIGIGAAGLWLNGTF